MKLSSAFFLAAALFALAGMAWGIQMSASHDHGLSPAHGHLNLLGFVAMGIWGAYYALTPGACGRLGWLHFGLACLSVVVLVPGIVLAIRDQGELLAQMGSLLAISNMALFAIIVLRNAGAADTGKAGSILADRV